MLKRIQRNLSAGFLNINDSNFRPGNFGKVQYFTANNATIYTFNMFLANMLMCVANQMLFFNSTPGF